VSLADMKTHLGVTHSHHDDMINAIQEAAVARYERETNLVIVNADFEMYFYKSDGYTHPVKVFKSPVEVASIKVYRQVDEVWGEITDDCTIRDKFSPATIEIDEPDSDSLMLKISFTAGPDTANPISPLAVQAVKMATKHWYNNRSEVEPVRSFQEVPYTFNSIVQMTRVFEF
jgi:uncharacterized phiE125 gp8 family phage protein